MGVLTITELPLELLKGELGMTNPSFVTYSTYEYIHSPRIRCPSTLWMTIRVSTGSVWPAGLELTMYIGHRVFSSYSQKFPKVNGANQTHERNYKAHFWFDAGTGLTCWRYFVWEAGAWVEDDWGGASSYDPNQVQAAVALGNSAGTGSPNGIGLHMENLRLLRGLH